MTFISKTGRLVYLAQLNDALNFFDMDIKNLPSLATPRLIITSRPPSSVKRGDSFAYQIETIGLSNQLNYQLTLAPAGVTVSSAGKLSWDIPSNFADSETTILLTVRSEQGAEDLQAIVLTVQ